MNVYFTASILQREQLKNEYVAIMQAINKLGHSLITAGDVMKVSVEEVLVDDDRAQKDYFLFWQKTIQTSEVGVVEASFPSTVHIGTEISALLERGKPVICLYTRGRNPAFTGKLHSSKLIKLEYNKETIVDVLKWALEEAENMLNRRFTFFVSPEIDNHLTKISQERSLPRSDYIRNLILQDMKKRK